jgi:hypothetical protein
MCESQQYKNLVPRPGFFYALPSAQRDEIKRHERGRHHAKTTATFRTSDSRALTAAEDFFAAA